MTIHFLSKIRQNEQDSIIEFDAAMEESTMDAFRVFEFRDPKSSAMNRIEVSETEVNIFSGPASINLELDKIVQIVYETNPGALLLDSHMTYLESTKEKVHFKYTLSHTEVIIGHYDIELTIKQ